MPSAEYKLLDDSHVKDFAEMVQALYLEDPEGEPINEEKIAGTIREAAFHPDKLKLYMFCREGRAIGYAILVFFWSNEYGGNIGHIDEMYVREEARGMGIAAAFFRHIVETEHSIIALELETTPSNRKAHDYYKKLGFSETANSHLFLDLKRKK